MNEAQDLVIEAIVRSIRQNHSFLVATHIRPDGDAVGSLLGLTTMLRRLGKTVDPYCQDPIPPMFRFLAGEQTVRSRIPDTSAYDVAILVDCAEAHRVGSELEAAIRQVPFLINIDHHYGSAPFGDISWVASSASSTCEMLYDLGMQLPVAPDREIAPQLYTGLLTDTGSFRFSNTTRRVLEIATHLVSAGAQPADIAQEVYDSAPPQRLYLLARMLNTVAFHAENRLATAELTLEMFEETASTPSDGEGFINYLRSVKPVEMAILFREEPEGIVNVSMRSKAAVDVARFAQRFRGGGHQRAAAFRVFGRLEAVRSDYTREALNYLSTL